MNKLTPQNLSFAVLLAGPLVFGAFGQAAEASTCVLAGAIGLAFANIDKIKRFKGAGFEAETRDQMLKAIIAKESEPEPYSERIFKDPLVSEEFNLNEGARKVLVALDNQKYTWRSIGGISEECNIPRPSVTRHLRSLKEAGLVAHAGMGRSTNWGLTALGREVTYQMKLEQS